MPDETRGTDEVLDGLTDDESDELDEDWSEEGEVKKGSSAVAVTSGDPSRLTDVGNAARFARDHSGEIRYAEGYGWLVWVDNRWAPDKTKKVRRLARRTARAIYDEAMSNNDPSKRAELARWAARAESGHGIKQMIDLARSEGPIVMPDDAFDRDPMVLNTASGIVNLKTGEIREPDPQSNLTKLSPAFYISTDKCLAECPLWEAFLDRVMGGNERLVEFLQRAVGYSITGRTDEQVLFLLHGEGQNGKSTFLEVIRAVLGSYAMDTPAETLLLKRGGGGVNNDVARLRKARFVTAIETEGGRRLAEGLVKQLTGGDTVTARYLYSEYFEFVPEFKLWLATNHKPQIKGVDLAIWRRIRMIPFEVTIPDEERDNELKSKLLGERSAILRWAIEGCLKWQREGLKAPQEVWAATENYRAQMDPINDFVSVYCIRDEVAQTPVRDLYRAYSDFAERNDRPSLSVRDFSVRMQKKGFAPGRTQHGRYLRGVGLRSVLNDGVMED